jgi:hypothetical protein
VVLTLLLPAAYVHRAVRPFRAWQVIGTIPIILLAMQGLDQWRAVGVKAIDAQDIGMRRAFDRTGSDLNALRGYTMLWELHRDRQLPLEYGGNYLLMALSPVPRAFWPEKPLTAFEPRWTERLFGRTYTSGAGGGGVWVFTAWGEGLAQFGVPGIPLNLWLFGMVVGAVVGRLETDSSLVLVLFYYSALAATYLRGGFQAVFILSWFQVIPVLGLCWAARRWRGARGPR